MEKREPVYTPEEWAALPDATADAVSEEDIEAFLELAK